MKIKQFVINNTQRCITLTADSCVSYQLSFEYLRISSPKVKPKQALVVSHKKQVMLLRIECVAKHGYRLAFDDQHDAIYSDEYLIKLVLEQDHRWQVYLTELEKSGHTREAMIEIKQVD
jgi:DUF971 family protein